ncbi:MAG: ABC transporter permease [Firmicutes bacterium]|nr:ABC transporter permease [Bacillota bacterium]
MMTIAVASFKETLRKKILLLIGILTLVYLVLFGFIIYHAVKDINQWDSGNNLKIYMMASQTVSILGFYFSSMLVAFLTIMASIGSVSSEIENGVIHSVITRPIKRMDYILGKYLGLAALIILYSVFLYTSVVLICILLQLPVMKMLGIPPLLKGLLFFILQPIAILSLSIFGSVRFKTTVNGIVVIALYILGAIGGMMEQIGTAIENTNLINWGIFSSLLAPFDVIYHQMLDAVFSDAGLANPMFAMSGMQGNTPSQWMMVYIFVYIIGLTALAVRRFEKRDIG